MKRFALRSLPAWGSCGATHCGTLLSGESLKRTRRVFVRFLPVMFRGKPRLERKKFARPKPKRGSVANAYAESSSVDQMRQALGIAGAGGQQKEDAFLKGEPEEVAERILRY